MNYKAIKAKLPGNSNLKQGYRKATIKKRLFIVNNRYKMTPGEMAKRLSTSKFNVYRFLKEMGLDYIKPQTNKDYFISYQIRAKELRIGDRFRKQMSCFEVTEIKDGCFVCRSFKYDGHKLSPVANIGCRSMELVELMQPKEILFGK